MPPSVLLVDAHDDRATAAALRDAGLDVREYGDLASARDGLDRSLDAVVTGHDLPDGTGVELLEDVREVAPDAACFLYTDVPLEAVDTEALGTTVAEYVPTESDPGTLSGLVEHAAEARTQTAYPLPDDEDARLDAVDALAPRDPDSDLREAMDRLTRVASALFGVPMASIGVVDAHQQRFLSCHGASWEPVERENTICAHAILDDEPTVIPDVHDDPRFADDAGLRDLGIRAYASANLTTPEGYAVGTFCVYDTAPREFGDDELALLATLAADATEHLRLRASLREGTDG